MTKQRLRCRNHQTAGSRCHIRAILPDGSHGFQHSLQLAVRIRTSPPLYLCSKSTGAVTSCTLKYLASAGYFRATASYIAYATLR